MRSMKYFRCAAAAGAVAIAAAGLAARSHADYIPPGWEANNMEPIGYSALDNRKGAFKMAIKKVKRSMAIGTSTWGICGITAGALWTLPIRRIRNS